jgi:SAM-dependent methyltransferase
MNIAAGVREGLRTLRGDRTLFAAANALAGAVALEPGGPSPLFAQRVGVPVYRCLAALDTLDYAEHTLWTEGPEAPRIDAPVRRRLIAEADRLQAVPDGSYDAVLSSHVVEHLANPLGALAEWRRVVRPGGHVLLIVPHRDGTFDHLRPVTSLEHLEVDAEHETPEDDLSHLPEVLALHDLELDPGGLDREQFERRCQENAATRAMHHHVFTSLTVFEVCTAAGLEMLMLRPKQPCNIFCLCRVGPGRGDELHECDVRRILAASPFASDRNGSGAG